MKMAGHVEGMPEMRNSYIQYQIENMKGRGSLGVDEKEKRNIEIGLKRRYGVDSSGSGWSSVAGSCGCRN
jgi:hypothetical protein